MIFRLLLLFLIVWFLFWMLKKQFGHDKPVDTEQKPKDIEDIIACAYCGTHVPRSLGVESAEKFYCSQQHADLDNEAN